MALANPLAVADFYDLFKVQDVQFVQAFQQQRSATGSHGTRYADRADTLWKAEITTVPMLNAEAEGIMALINSRAGGIKTFLMYNTRLAYPSPDPLGAIIGATVPKLGTITDRIHVAFTGFPNSYVVPRGTYFSILYDTDEYYLGQFAESKTSNPITGTIGATEIWPPLPASITGTPDIVIAKPPAKFGIVPGSAYPAKEGGLNSTIKFSAEQA